MFNLFNGLPTFRSDLTNVYSNDRMLKRNEPPRCRGAAPGWAWDCIQGQLVVVVVWVSPRLF